MSCTSVKRSMLRIGVCRLRLLLLIFVFLAVAGVKLWNLRAHPYGEVLTRWRQGWSSPISRWTQVRRLRQLRVRQVNCTKVMSNDSVEVSRATAVVADARDSFDSSALLSTNCGVVRDSFVTVSLSDLEAATSLAFSVLVYKDALQVARLLRAVYRPEHFYCLHVDRKSPPEFRRQIRQLGECFDNVEVISEVSVKWHTISTIQAELACFWHLLRHRWSHVINLTGQEFPLATNRQLAETMVALGNASVVDNYVSVGSYDRMRLPGLKGDLKWRKGSTHVVLSRSFAEFLFSDSGRRIANALRRQPGRSPPADETIFATVDENFKVDGRPPRGIASPRYKNWVAANTRSFPCLSNKIVRQLCIWGVQDLPAMRHRRDLFVNKLYRSFQPMALACLEDQLWRRTEAEAEIDG